jgi:Fur family transcriptional regulator, ferric uptake regulator
VPQPSHPTVSPESLTVPAEIQSRLERAGLRRTLATRAVLGLFLAQPRTSWSHTQALASLAARGLAIDRVTLYRLLDRLAACGVLQRQAVDGARTWRYRLVDSDDGLAPRFECDACHRQFRLTEASAPTQAVASDLFRTLASLGHQGVRVDVSIHGTCASCLPGASTPGEPSP